MLQWLYLNHGRIQLKTFHSTPILVYCNNNTLQDEHEAMTQFETNPQLFSSIGTTSEDPILLQLEQ